MNNQYSIGTRIVTLTRGEQRVIVVLRQLPQDEQAIVGKKFRYGSGPKWLVVEVQ